MHNALRKSPATTVQSPHCMPVALPLLDNEPPFALRRVRVPRELFSRIWDASFAFLELELPLLSVIDDLPHTVYLNRVNHQQISESLWSLSKLECKNEYKQFI